MTSYEFIKSDFTKFIGNRSFDILEIENRIKNSLKGDYTLYADYQNTRFMLMEVTQSCSRAETISWLRFYMLNAIAYGITTKELDWKTKFLATLDMYRSIVPNIAGSNKFLRFNQIC